MEIDVVFEIILCLASVALTFLSYYFSVKSKIRKMSEDAINCAEELNRIGEEKMKIAVENIRNAIPTAMRPLFSDEFIKRIVQDVFDKMKSFAEKRALKVEKDGVDA